MKILKHSRKKSGDNKSIGGEIPLSLYSYLCLYVEAKGLNRSEVLRMALTLLKDQSEDESQLIDLLVTLINNQWKILKNQNISYVQFVGFLEVDLKQSGISYSIIGIILEKIKK